MKPWYTSKTIQGSLASLIALLVNTFFAKEFADAGLTSEAVISALLTLISVLGTVWSIFGRFVAKDKLMVGQPKILTEDKPPVS